MRFSERLCDFLVFAPIAVSQFLFSTVYMLLLVSVSSFVAYCCLHFLHPVRPQASSLFHVKGRGLIPLASILELLCII